MRKKKQEKKNNQMKRKNNVGREKSELEQTTTTAPTQLAHPLSTPPTHAPTCQHAICPRLPEPVHIGLGLREAHIGRILVGREVHLHVTGALDERLEGVCRRCERGEKVSVIGSVIAIDFLLTVHASRCERKKS